jgi:hypothetical protein
VYATTFDNPPLDSKTAISTTAATAIRPDGTAASNAPDPTYVVASEEPFHRITASAANALPFTVKVKEDAPAAAKEGVKELITGAATGCKRIEAYWDSPFSVAVIVAFSRFGISPVMAVNVAVAEPADTVTDAGIVRSAVLADKATTYPLAGATFVSTTVHRPLIPGPNAVGLQINADSETDGVQLRVVLLDTPFHVAVKVAVELLPAEPTDATNAALTDPAGTVTEDGTLRAALLLERTIGMPSAGANAFRVTLHSAFWPILMVAGTHVSEVRVGTTMVAPAAAETSSRAAAALAPVAFDIVIIAAALTLGAILTST